MYIDRIDINEPLGGGIVSRSFKVFNDKDFDEKSLPIKDSIEDLASKSTKVVNSWPVTGHGTHLIMDDKGLKAVTSWDEERGYRRIVYNRDPVLYIEASGPDQVKLNGEMVDLVEGSNYFEVEEITSDSRFGNENPNHVTDVIVRCKLPSDLGNNFSNTIGIFNMIGSLNSIELYIDNNITKLYRLLTGYIHPANIQIPVKYINTTVWDTSNVTSMNYIFQNCSSLTSLDLSNWDTSSVTSMSYMFQNCSSLTSLDLSNLDISNIYDMDYAFHKCSKLHNINSSLNITFKHNISMMWLCNQCTSLESFEVPGWVANVTDFRYTFENCPNLERLDLSGINLSKWSSSKIPGNWEIAHYSTKLTYLRFPGLGTLPVGGGGQYIGLNNPLDHDSLMSIFTYDRISNGLQYITVFLSSASKGYLTDEEKAEITAKGYTIA